ncbi:MAG: GxxExxY protein [Ferruginibacter sp.]|nr:GxxExxY protein [Ferruginibacter sp.]
MEDNYKHSEITDLVIKAFYKVYNKLGYGFLERVYLNALVLELLTLELVVKKEQPIIVFYNGMEVGKYIADLIVNDCIIVELKATEILKEEHEAQLTNYLRATEIDVGLLLNFGKKPQIKRKVFTSIKNE